MLYPVSHQMMKNALRAHLNIVTQRENTPYA